MVRGLAFIIIIIIIKCTTIPVRGKFINKIPNFDGFGGFWYSEPHHGSSSNLMKKKVE